MWKCIPNEKMGFFIWQLYGFRKELEEYLQFIYLYATDFYVKLMK